METATCSKPRPSDSQRKHAVRSCCFGRVGPRTPKRRCFLCSFLADETVEFCHPGPTSHLTHDLTPANVASHWSGHKNTYVFPCTMLHSKGSIVELRRAPDRFADARQAQRLASPLIAWALRRAKALTASQVLARRSTDSVTQEVEGRTWKQRRVLRPELQTRSVSMR